MSAQTGGAVSGPTATDTSDMGAREVGLPRPRDVAPAREDAGGAAADLVHELVGRIRQVEDELATARRDVASAREQSRQAHRDSARLIRLLKELARPASDAGAVLGRALETLSEVFAADVVCLVRGGAPQSSATERHVVVASCGFRADVLPVLPELPAELTVAWAGSTEPLQCASWSSSREVLQVAGVWIRSAARLVLDPADASAGALLVLRSGEGAISANELKLLQSVTERLHAAVQAAERRGAAEVLAVAGDRFTRHNEEEGLLVEAAGLLAELTGAEWVGVVQVRTAAPNSSGAPGVTGVTGVDGTCPGGPAMLAAQAGSLELDLSHQWPRPTSTLLGWQELAAGRAVLCHDLITVPEHPNCPPRSGVRTVLSVPVVAEGLTQVLLYALHRTPSAFSGITVEAVEQLSGSLSGALVSARLYAALEASEQQARHRATHDALTGLANRTLFREELERRLVPRAVGGTSSAPAMEADPGREGGADADADAVGVIFCDLDDFKGVNDRLGHDAGDQLLRQVSQRLLSTVRPNDLLARLGGDEFVVLLDPVPGDAAVQKIGERLLASLSEPFHLEGQRGSEELVSVGGSFGGALGSPGPDPAQRTKDLICNADAAMYEAKHGGGRRVLTYDAAAAHRATLRAELAHDVTSAVQLEQVHVLYQPVWDLAGDRAVGVEALARWTHPVQGPVAPDVFIPLAERAGAVAGLGRFVLRAALEEASRWDAGRSSRLTVSVNASPLELREPRYCQHVLTDLAEHGIHPGRLFIEITEGLPLGGTELERIAELRDAGVRVLIDDFGVSHSDLARLKHLPADGLKIDKSLVRGLSAGLDADPMDRGIVQAIVTLAATAGLSVVAEGVETTQQREALLALGCSTAQGFLMGRPMSASSVAMLL